MKKTIILAMIIVMVGSMMVACEENIGGDAKRVQMSRNAHETHTTMLGSEKNELNLLESISDVDDRTYTKEDFPEELKDSMITNNKGIHYNYKQEITLGDAKVKFDQDDDYDNNPVFFLDMGGSNSPENYYKITFEKEASLLGLARNEKMNMFGKEFRFLDDVEEGRDIVMYDEKGRKITLPVKAISPEEKYAEIVVNDNEDGDIYVWMEGTDVKNIKSITFRIDPTDFTNANTGEDWDWLVMGDEYTDGMFGFGTMFAGMEPGLKGRSELTLQSENDGLLISFENEKGEIFNIKGYDLDKKGAVEASIVLKGKVLREKDQFILEEGESSIGYEVEKISSEQKRVTLKRLSDGTKESYSPGEEIAKTGVKIGSIAVDDGFFTISEDVKDYVTIKGGLKATLGEGEFPINIYEDEKDMVEMEADHLRVSLKADEGVKIGRTKWEKEGVKARDQEGDREFGMSRYGTFYESDENYLRTYYSEEETDFNVAAGFS